MLVELGTVELKKGENTLQLTLTGANEKTKRDAFFFGIDYLELRKATAGN